jgi:hypothetical protein
VAKLCTRLRDNVSIPILKLRPACGSVNKKSLLQVIEALQHNTSVRVAYLQRVDDADDEVLLALIGVLQQCRIWAVNLGEWPKVTRSGTENYDSNIDGGQQTKTHTVVHD